MEIEKKDGITIISTDERLDAVGRHEDCPAIASGADTVSTHQAPQGLRNI